MKIYIIVNTSYELDEYPDERIEFISTSLEEINSMWEKQYVDFTTMDSNKWIYSAELREYENGYNYYIDKFKVLKTVSNIK